MAVPKVVDIDLPPDIFAIVMATGIVAIAADDHRYIRIWSALAGIASVVFVALAAGLGLRMLLRRDVIIAQARDPDVALRMFTFVAAASVLGVIWLSRPPAVWALAALGVIGWLVLVPLGLRDVRSRPRTDLRDHAHGAWLLASVATSGLATTAGDLGLLQHAGALVVIGVLLLLLALVLYAAVTWLIAWRTVVAPFRPDTVTPDSWILMGALAIATLAGAHLVKAANGIGSFAWLTDWLGPFTIALWTAASLWIPVLLYAEVWRVDRQAGSLRFAGVWWSAVFPLGMYSSATAATGLQLQLPSLATISLVFFWIAFTVWIVVAVGMAQTALLRLRWRRR